MAVTLSAALNALASTSAPDKVIVLEGSTAKQTDPENVSGAGYLKYVAMLSQTGTGAPTATVLENTLGGTVVWSYNGNGSYDATLTAAFTADKTFVLIGGSGSATGFHTAYRDGDNIVTVQTFDSGSPANDMLAETPLEIRVYP